eukprot:2616457-Rhodomonas_salina.1
MEQRCISHRELEGFKALAPTCWIPARQQISQKHQAIIAEAKRVFQIGNFLRVMPHKLCR